MGCSTSNMQILRKKMMLTKETKTNGSNFKRELKTHSLQNDDKVYDHTIAKVATDETLSTTSTNHTVCNSSISSETIFLSSGKIRKLEQFETLTVSEKINKLREKISPIKEDLATDKVTSSTEEPEVSSVAEEPEVSSVAEEEQEKNKNSRHADKLKRFEQLSNSEKISNLRKKMNNSPYLLKGKNSPKSIRKSDHSKTTSKNSTINSDDIETTTKKSRIKKSEDSETTSKSSTTKSDDSKTTSKSVITKTDDSESKSKNSTINSGNPKVGCENSVIEMVVEKKTVSNAKTTSRTLMKRSSSMSATNARTRNKRPNVSSLETTKSDYSMKKQRLKKSDWSEVNKENDENNTAQSISVLAVSSQDQDFFTSMFDSLLLSSKSTENANNTTNNAQIADSSVNITLKNGDNSIKKEILTNENLVLKENTSLNKKKEKRLVPVSDRYKNVKPRVYEPRASKYILPNKNSEKANLSGPKLRGVSSAIMAPNNIKYAKGSTVPDSKPLKKTKSFR